MSSFDGRRSDEDNIPTVQYFEGIGELTVGGAAASGDVNRILFTSLAVLNNPTVNAYLLANKLKLSDRITKTKIFPRDGMPLPNGEVYQEPQEEVVSEEQENK
ncbi:MAG: hypothetical protein GF334_03040 [Candidatus Altiarchaeales archaeon]|nr:hypothetical protein [Candidatus Altiarchaeales archaeon]